MHRYSDVILEKNEEPQEESACEEAEVSQEIEEVLTEN